MDDLNARLQAGIDAANAGRTKDLGDFAQYATEEPAWARTLREELDDRFISSSDEIFALVEAHILAAEERGREAALREAAEEFYADAERSDEVRRTEILGGVAYLLRLKAES